MNNEELLVHLRAAASAATDDLHELVATMCPEGSDQHSPTQHRDRKPPWCNACGRDWRGVLQHEPTA